MNDTTSAVPANLGKKMPPILLVTYFLPRMEMDHLASWLRYHLDTGITEIVLYDSGHVANDKMYQSTENSRIWGKKPEANFHLELSDDDVDRRIQGIVREFGSAVRWEPWRIHHTRKRGYRSSRLSAINQELKAQKKKKKFEWIGHLDIDELIVCKRRSLKEYLSHIDTEVNSISISQKVFEKRWQDGTMIPYSQITRTRGVVSFNRKVFSRVHALQGWVNPHKVRISSGRRLIAYPEFLRYHHFHGFNFAANVRRRWRMKDYETLNNVALQADFSHVQRLLNTAHDSES